MRHAAGNHLLRDFIFASSGARRIEATSGMKGMTP